MKETIIKSLALVLITIIFFILGYVIKLVAGFETAALVQLSLIAAILHLNTDNKVE